MDPQLKHKFFDPNIPRKGTVLNQHLEGAPKNEASIPLFSVVEFNLSGLCNRVCVFCPRVDPNVFPNINEHIPVELYEKIMTELAEVAYDGMILFSGFGEPLLYKNVESLIEMSKRYCPDARLEIITNGDQTTPAKLRSLFAAGLDTLLISLYDGPHQVPEFQAMIDEVGLSESQVVLRTRWLPPEEHYGITLVNRSGMVEIPAVGIGKISEPINRRCFYPFYHVQVDYDGSVLLCTHDWGKKLIVGNLNDQTIHELWTNDTMKQIRESLAASKRTFLPCSGCDVDGTLMGKGHFASWMKYYESQVSAND